MADLPPDRQAYFARWSGTHGGYDPAGSRAARWWLGLAYRVGVPLARRGVAPGTVTAAGVLAAAAVPAPAAAGGRWLLAAAALAVLSGLLDSLDGCVAVLSGRVTAVGYVADSVADRFGDGLLVLALWLGGAPGGLCVAAGAAGALLEYARARTANAGYGEIGVVTIGERPTRVIVTALALLAAGVVAGHQPAVAGIGAGVLLAIGVVACVQWGVVARRALSG